MTATLTPEAQHRLDRYLQEVRLLLSGSTHVDAADVEGDVREHIAAALASREGTVTTEELEGVLQRLGSPSQWLGADEIPLWRKLLTRLYLGEDWRLAYACLGITVLGAILLFAGSPVSLVLFAAGYLLARAAVSLAGERGEELGARRWLVLAPIVVVVAPVLLAVLTGPFIPLGQVGYEQGWFASLGVGPLGTDPQGREVLVRIGIVLLGAGVWWGMLAAAWGPVRRVLTPLTRPLFTPGPRQRRWLVLAGLLLTAAGAGMLLLLGPGRPGI